jgi:hypothetical protein
METKTGKQQFDTEIFPAELEEIRQRRIVLNLDTTDVEGPPSTQLGLVGLALSGGGIRSATFCLGVIQSLARHGILKSVDYLSTVSGGGFIGACLSSTLNRAHVSPEGSSDFPLHHEPGQTESATIRHLRNSSNYLAPGGLLEKTRIPTLLLQGILTNFMIFLPYIMLAVVFTEIAYELRWKTKAPVHTVFLGVAGLCLALFLTFPYLARLVRSRFNWSQRNRYELLLSAALLTACGLVGSMAIVFPIVQYAVEHSWQEVATEFATQHLLSTAHAWTWLPILAAIALFLIVGKASERAAKLSGKLLLGAIGIVGPSLLLVIYLALCVLQIDSFVLSHNLSPSDLNQMRVSDALRKALSQRGDLPRDAIVVKKQNDWWQITDVKKSEIYYNIRTIRQPNKAPKLRIEESDLWDGHGDSLFLGIGLLLLLMHILWLDVNATAAHGFYRDRLSKAYLIQQRWDGELLANDEQPLSTLNAAGTAAPYHLINVALNLHGSKDPNVRGRNADFFMFSKRFTGSERTGFCPTELIETYDRHVNLGTAMAISGAAAAPNMGSTTVKPLVFILTLLNIRLGYWLPNPGWVQQSSRLARWLWRGAGPSYLWKEAMGNVHAQGRYVNLSDGGHLENLGIYPLLRRRCKLIVAVDAEADHGMRFHGLTQLIRFARIDMGIQIDIDLRDIGKDSQGFSRTSWTLGRIQYSECETGHLLYLKASMCGHENAYVQSYKADHAAFPHEPTSEQFFNETQFEVYRALGYHIVNRFMCEEPEILASLWPNLQSAAHFESGATDAPHVAVADNGLSDH